MISKILNVLLIILAIGLIAHYFYIQPKFEKGQVIPAFGASLIDGSDFHTDDLKGQYVLLDFWGSWCGPCRKDNAKLVNLYESHNDNQYVDATGFQIVSIAIEENDKAWKNAIVSDRLSWKYHIGQLERFNSPIVKQYGVREIPTKYLLGPTGEIIGVNQSIDEIDSFLNTKMVD